MCEIEIAQIHERLDDVEGSCVVRRKILSQYLDTQIQNVSHCAFVKPSPLSNAGIPYT